MLVLSRKEGERIVIGDQITLVVSKVSGNRVTLGIEAPKDVKIKSAELRERFEATGVCANLLRAFCRCKGKWDELVDLPALTESSSLVHRNPNRSLGQPRASSAFFSAADACGWTDRTRLWITPSTRVVCICWSDSTSPMVSSTLPLPASVVNE
jgi:carbon storage regulator CsrA